MGEKQVESGSQQLGGGQECSVFYSKVTVGSTLYYRPVCHLLFLETGPPT